MKNLKWIMIGAGGLALIALVAGVATFGLVSQASAQSSYSPIISSMTGQGPDMRGGMKGHGGGDELLAEALGITVEELQQAREAANKAAIQQAVDEGYITQAQADQLLAQDGRPRGGRGFIPFVPEGTIDMEALLADALGITTDELADAQETAFQAGLDQQIEDGRITEEQAAMIEAQHALKDTIDPNALMAEALGISADQLESYREQRMSLTDILEELGMTEEAFSAARTAAYEAALANAVQAGVITQAQADLLLANSPDGMGMGMRPDGGRHGMPPGGMDGQRPGPGGGMGRPDCAPEGFQNPQATPDSTTQGTSM